MDYLTCIWQCRTTRLALTAWSLEEEIKENPGSRQTAVQVHHLQHFNKAAGPPPSTLLSSNTFYISQDFWALVLDPSFDSVHPPSVPQVFRL